MSRKNAFAFRDFDKDRILSREFFRKLNLPTGSDKEILQSFPVDTIDEMETTSVALKILANKLSAFNHFLGNCVIRYSKVIGALGAKLLKADDLKVLPSFKEKASTIEQRMTLTQKAMNEVAELENVIYSRVDTLDNDIKKICQNTFANRLKQARKKYGWTQEQIAEKLQLTRAGYVSYETARREPSLLTLYRLSKIFNLPTGWFLGLN